LFLDFIVRYPESFQAIKAQVDFEKYFKEEQARMNERLGEESAKTLIKRLEKTGE